MRLRRHADAKVMGQATALGARIGTADEWRMLWAASGLVDQTAVVAPSGLHDEPHSRMQCVGLPWLLRAHGRLIRLLREQPQSHQAIRHQLRVPSGRVRRMGFALVTRRWPG